MEAYLTDTPNAVVCLTQTRAAALRDFFGLPHGKWLVFGFGQSLRGYRFDAVIVDTTGATEQHLDWLENQLKRKVVPGRLGSVKLIVGPDVGVGTRQQQVPNPVPGPYG